MHEDKFKVLLSATIPKEEESEDKVSNICLANFYKLKQIVTEHDLYNLDYIMYKAVEYFSDMEGILRKPYLYMYLESSINKLLRHKNVKVNEIIMNDDHTFNLNSDGDFEIAKREIMTSLSEYYDELQEIDTSSHEFNSVFKLYADEMYEMNFMEILQKTAIIASRGLDVFNGTETEFIKGPEHANEYYSRNVALITNKYRIEEHGIIDTSGPVSQIKEKEKAQEALYDVISNTGIKPIDESLNDFRRTQLIGIEAGAGVGKTRFARWVGYRALTMFKKNVLDITMEQEDTEIWSLYVSTHLFVKYNVYIPDSDIKRNKVPEEMQHLVQIAKMDLFKNPEYGKLRIEAKDLYIEETFEYLTSIHRTVFRYDCLILDYASLVDSKARDKYSATTHEIVTQVYKRTKRDICRKLKVLGIILNQLARSGVEKLNKGELTSTYDGSNTGETYKSTDGNLVLSQDKSQERDGVIQFTSPKFRDAEKFYKVYAQVKLGCSYFEYTEEAEISENEFEEALEGALSV